MPIATANQINESQAPRSKDGVKSRQMKNGKTKWTSTVWYDNKYFCSKTFSTEAHAKAHHVANLQKAIRGDLDTAADRKADSKLNEMLQRSMNDWAQEFLEQGKGKDLSETRRADFDLVGRLLAERRLTQFSGVKGAHLISQIQNDWTTDRRPKSSTPTPIEAKPLSENTVRLRITALNQIIKYAKSCVLCEKDDAFVMPDMSAVHGYKLPKPHARPRKREPRDNEVVQILRAVGPDSEFGEYLRTIYDSGCRLSEVPNVEGTDVAIDRNEHGITGGSFHLEHHKTADTIGERDVPLSQFAAEILAARKERFGAGRLFPALTFDMVLDVFADAKESAEIEDLQMKDFRRAFINRNKSSASSIDLYEIFGNSSLLEGDCTQSERDTMAATGHKRRQTMAGYNVVDAKRLSKIFTATSRWPAIAAQLGKAVPRPSVSTPNDMAARFSPEILALAESLQRGVLDFTVLAAVAAQCAAVQAQTLCDSTNACSGST